jgi:hypothetical protein
MDANEFLGTEWLKAEAAGMGVAAAREEIGAHWGWGTGWYASDGYLIQLFAFLNDPATPLHTGDGRSRADLLAELAYAAGEDRQAAWLATVGREVYWSAPENRYGPPEFSEPHGMNYRYDKLRQVYEWEDPRQPGTWISQQEADAQVIAWQQAPEQAGAGKAENAGEAGFSAAVWDENWQMLYRVGPGGVYEYAYSDDHATIRPGTSWLSYDEAAQGAGPAELSAAGTASASAAGTAGSQVPAPGSSTAGLEPEVTRLSQEEIAEVQEKHVAPAIKTLRAGAADLAAELGVTEQDLLPVIDGIAGLPVPQLLSELQSLGR